MADADSKDAAVAVAVSPVQVDSFAAGANAAETSSKTAEGATVAETPPRLPPTVQDKPLSACAKAADTGKESTDGNKTVEASPPLEEESLSGSRDEHKPMPDKEKTSPPLAEESLDENKDGEKEEEKTANEDPRRALRLELQQRRPSALRVQKICRNGLKGRLPPDLRADIWQLLLGVDSKDRFLLDDSIRDTTQDLDNQRVIRVDAQRTRADVEYFRNPEVELLVSKLLTYYCKRKAIR